MSTKTPKFYVYNQNNSGGKFIHDAKAGIGYAVIIEATTEESAEFAAENIGLYFDGYGDCECCGNRWYPYASKYKTIEEIPKSYLGGWGIPSYIHFLNGEIKEVNE